jgi:hypothetical protein
MQKDFPMVAKIELQLTQECEMDHLPNRPSKRSSRSITFVAMSLTRSEFDSYYNFSVCSFLDVFYCK